MSYKCSLRGVEWVYVCNHRLWKCVDKCFEMKTSVIDYYLNWIEGINGDDDDVFSSLCIMYGREYKMSLLSSVYY